MRQTRHPLALGVALVGFGVILLLGGLDLPVVAELFRFWPLFLIAVGLWHLLPNGTDGRRSLADPERLLVALVAIAGLVTTLFGGDGRDWHRETGRLTSVRVPPPMSEDLVVREELRTAMSPEAILELDVHGAEVDLQPCDEPGVTIANVASSPSDPDPGRLELAPAANGRVVLRFALRGAPGQHARLTVLVPPGAAVTGRLTDSTLYARGIASADLDAGGSELRLVDIRGEVAARVTNGTLLAETIANAIKIEAMNANVRVTAAGSDVEVRSSYSDVELNGVAGAIDVEAGSARVSLSDIAGESQVRARRCHVLMRNLAGGGSIETTAGMIRGNRLDGDFTIVGLESNVSLQNTSGSLKVHGTERRLTIVRAAGELEIQAERSVVVLKQCRATVTVELVGGSLDLGNNQGSVRARATDADLTLEANPGSPIEFSGQRSSIGIRFGPAGGQFDLHAKAGSILASRDTSLSQQIEQQSGEAQLTASFGSARTPITGTVEQGVIRLIHR